MTFTEVIQSGSKEKSSQSVLTSLDASLPAYNLDHLRSDGLFTRPRPTTSIIAI